MRKILGTRCWRSVIAACVVLVLTSGAAGPSGAGTPGTLKLKVIRCLGASWLCGAQVAVSVTRSGEGEIASASGYTSSSGYVEFSFSDLEAGDEAQVTVTPSGEDPDGSHEYTWDDSGGRGGGVWELSATGGDSSCEDSWYDEQSGIFECVYR